MTKYDYLYETIQSQYDHGIISEETAEYLNDVAYEMYADGEIDEDDNVSEATSTSSWQKSRYMTDAINRGMINDELREKIRQDMRDRVNQKNIGKSIDKDMDKRVNSLKKRREVERLEIAKARKMDKAKKLAEIKDKKRQLNKDNITTDDLRMGIGEALMRAKLRSW